MDMVYKITNENKTARVTRQDVPWKQHVVQFFDTGELVFTQYLMGKDSKTDALTTAMEFVKGSKPDGQPCL